MNYKRVLTVQDISCVGQCSMTVALPVLSVCGVEACPLPTAILSTHTGGLGKPHIRSLVEDLRPTLAHWRENQFLFDGVLCGYLGNRDEIEIVGELADTMVVPGGLVIVDPAMADHGKLYSGFDGAYVEAMKSLCKKADYVLPNLTELCLLTDAPYREDFSELEMETMANSLLRDGCKGVVLTGVSVGNEIGILLKTATQSLWYRHKCLPKNCHGTGDLFAAVFAGVLTKGGTPEQAIQIASRFTLSAMELTIAENTRPYGLMFEPLLGQLLVELDGIFLRAEQ